MFFIGTTDDVMLTIPDVTSMIPDVTLMIPDVMLMIPDVTLMIPDVMSMILAFAEAFYLHTGNLELKILTSYFIWLTS